MRQKPDRRRFLLLQAGALASTLVLADAPGNGAGADEAGGSRAPAAKSSRIVSIGGSITEILYALGLQQNVVAVDSTSIYPPNALQDKPSVGYMRRLSPEGVLALQPTLILAIEGAGPKEAIDVLKQANVPLVIVPDKFTGADVIDKIRTISREVGVPERGNSLAGAVQRDLSELDMVRARIRQRVRVAFLLSLVDGRPTMSGRNTAAAGIVELAGARNAFDEFQGYKVVNDEAVIAAQPDVILAIPQREHVSSAETILSHRAIAMTPAAARKSFIWMDGLYLLGFGPRTASAARDLALKLYPDLAVSALPSERATSGAGRER